MTIAETANKYVYDCGWNAAVAAITRMVCLEAETRVCEQRGAPTVASLLKLADDISAMERPSRLAGMQRGAGGMTTYWMEKMMQLEIRHRMWPDGGAFVVAETFGDQPEQRWTVQSREIAEALIAERKAMLLEMIGSISAKAKEAVEDARHIDNLKAGHS